MVIAIIIIVALVVLLIVQAVRLHAAQEQNDELLRVLERESKAMLMLRGEKEKAQTEINDLILKLEKYEPPHSKVLKALPQKGRNKVRRQK